MATTTTPRRLIAPSAMDETINLRLYGDVLSKVDALAAHEHVTRSAMARTLIDEALHHRRVK